MRTGLHRAIAVLLLLLLTPAIWALALDDAPALACCKKTAHSCCKRTKTVNGPSFSASAPCGTRCGQAVRSHGAARLPVLAPAGVATRVEGSAQLAALPDSPSIQTQFFAYLYQRPPPQRA